ncbi:MAG: hypothetical protein ACHP65_09065 [Legionellales bacterium]
MFFKTTSVALGCLLSLTATAGTMGHTGPDAEYRPWSVIGSLGYTWYDAAYHGGSNADPAAQASIGDGQTAFGRFAVAREFGVYSGLHFGAEVGVQSGNTFRLNIAQEAIDPLGGILPQASIKPMLDLLASATYQPDSVPAFGLIKLGVAYRRMQINDRVTFNDLSQAAFEVQAGIGMHLSDRANLSLNYQGVFNGSTTYTINTTQFTGKVSNIPSLNGLLLSLSYAV